MFKKIFFTLHLILFTLAVYGQLTIRVTSIPDNTPANATIYIAGNFNNWTSGDANYTLAHRADGSYDITINPAIGEVKYKFTRGNWDSVEGNENGGFRPDRVFNYSGSPITETLSIAGWEDLGGGGNPGGNSTATSNVEIISTNFSIPQLNRDRRIWIYLPPDYSTSGKNYPVLYMHDGQNLFDLYQSSFGEWEVDESMNALFHNGDDSAIVVGIDNGGSNRLNEYSPWVNPQYGGGEGDEYIDFIVETLKPYIDSNYRTLRSRENTGIMGSSMGGLISMYAAIEHQDVFSKAGIYSPAFWFSPEVFNHVHSKGKQYPMKFYLLAGEQESETMVPLLNDMNNALAAVGFSENERFLRTHADGAHSEWYWKREYQGGYLWLYSDAVATGVRSYDHTGDLNMNPNPATNILKFETDQDLSKAMVRIYSMDGRLINTINRIQNRELDVSFLEKGVYIVLVISDCMPLVNQKLIIK